MGSFRISLLGFLCSHVCGFGTTFFPIICSTCMWCPSVVMKWLQPLLSDFACCLYARRILSQCVTVSMVNTLAACLARCTHLYGQYIDSHENACRVADYWEGYKLFCYAYHSHSVRHEAEFRESKLGSWTSHHLMVCAPLRRCFPQRIFNCFCVLFSLRCPPQCMCCT